MKGELTPGQTHDSQPAPDMLEDMQKRAILLADKAFDSESGQTFGYRRLF